MPIAKEIHTTKELTKKCREHRHVAAETRAASSRGLHIGEVGVGRGV